MIVSSRTRKRQVQSRTYPRTLSQHQARKAVGTGGDEARGATDITLVHDGDFQEILSKRTSLQVVVISLADLAQETHRARPSQLKLEHAQHEALSLEDLVHAIPAIHHVDDLLDRRTVDLFVLGSDEDCSGSHKLELAQRDNLARKEAINVVDTQEERLGEKREAMVHLHQPIHENRPHGPLDLRLIVHVMSIRQHFNLDAK